VSLDILLWAFLASYVIHIVDETTMNGGFIQWIRASFWPTYTARMNFWFNGGAVVGIAASNLLYDLFGGHWIILALVWPSAFALHGITVHLFWTVRQRNLSPGLVTSVISGSWLTSSCGTAWRPGRLLLPTFGSAPSSAS